MYQINESPSQLDYIHRLDIWGGSLGEKQTKFMLKSQIIEFRSYNDRKYHPRQIMGLSAHQQVTKCQLYIN